VLPSGNLRDSRKAALESRQCHGFPLVSAITMRTVVLIIGAGFSGTVLAVNLLRRASAKPTDIVLVERAREMNRGVAYAERDIPYFLNVPAGRLSADSADAQQFLGFARERFPETDQEDFLPRALYGEYLEKLLKTAELESSPQMRLTRVHDEVLDLLPAGMRFEARFAQREPIRADKVILAVGNPPASSLPWLKALRGHRAIRENPWELTKDLQPHHSVLIVGSGLTMADVVLNLSWNPERVPKMHAISRRGLLPQVQTVFQHCSVCGGPEELLAKAHSVRALLKASRELARKAAAQGGDWREVVTFIRNIAPKIWQKLPLKEQARFIRHLQAHWDTHRHRLPPQVAERLAQVKSSGKLEVNAGRVQRVEALPDRIRVHWLPRGGHHPSSLDVDLIVNATGPDYVVARTSEPLLRSLQTQDLITSDALSLGISTDGAGACLNARGEPATNLFYLGPMLRADHWEATAATELRDHAERLAVRLTA
jgi:uncharacterized NAD(P)/FAD-binding protein YdhS